MAKKKRTPKSGAISPADARAKAGEQTAAAAEVIASKLPPKTPSTPAPKNAARRAETKRVGAQPPMPSSPSKSPSDNAARKAALDTAANAAKQPAPVGTPEQEREDRRTSQRAELARAILGLPKGSDGKPIPAPPADPAPARQRNTDGTPEGKKAAASVEARRAAREQARVDEAARIAQSRGAQRDSRLEEMRGHVEAIRTNPAAVGLTSKALDLLERKLKRVSAPWSERRKQTSGNDLTAFEDLHEQLTTLGNAARAAATSESTPSRLASGRTPTTELADDANTTELTASAAGPRNRSVVKDAIRDEMEWADPDPMSPDSRPFTGRGGPGNPLRARTGQPLARFNETSDQKMVQFTPEEIRSAKNEMVAVKKKKAAATKATKRSLDEGVAKLTAARDASTDPEEQAEYDKQIAKLNTTHGINKQINRIETEDEAKLGNLIITIAGAPDDLPPKPQYVYPATPGSRAGAGRTDGGAGPRVTEGIPEIPGLTMGESARAYAAKEGKRRKINNMMVELPLGSSRTTTTGARERVDVQPTLGGALIQDPRVQIESQRVPNANKKTIDKLTAERDELKSILDNGGEHTEEQASRYGAVQAELKSSFSSVTTGTMASRPYVIPRRSANPAAEKPLNTNVVNRLDRNRRRANASSALNDIQAAAARGGMRTADVVTPTISDEDAPLVQEALDNVSKPVTMFNEKTGQFETSTTSVDAQEARRSQIKGVGSSGYSLRRSEKVPLSLNSQELGTIKNVISLNLPNQDRSIEASDGSARSGQRTRVNVNNKAGYGKLVSNEDIATNAVGITSRTPEGQENLLNTAALMTGNMIKAKPRRDVDNSAVTRPITQEDIDVDTRARQRKWASEGSTTPEAARADDRRLRKVMLQMRGNTRVGLTEEANYRPMSYVDGAIEPTRRERANGADIPTDDQVATARKGVNERNETVAKNRGLRKRTSIAVQRGKSMDAARDARHQEWVGAGASPEVASTWAERGQSPAEAAHRWRQVGGGSIPEASINSAIMRGHEVPDHVWQQHQEASQARGDARRAEIQTSNQRTEQLRRVQERAYGMHVNRMREKTKPISEFGGGENDLDFSDPGATVGIGGSDLGRIAEERATQPRRTQKNPL